MQGASFRHMNRQVYRPCILRSKRQATSLVYVDISQQRAAALAKLGFPPEAVKIISQRQRQCSLENMVATFRTLKTKVGLNDKEVHKLATNTSTLLKVDAVTRLDELVECINENNVSMDVCRRLVTGSKWAFALKEDTFRMVLDNIRLLIPFYKKFNVPERKWFTQWRYKLCSRHKVDLDSCIEFLVGFAGVEGARKIIQRHPAIANIDIEKQLKNKIERYRAFGLSQEQLIKVIRSFPRFCGEDNFLAKREFFEDMGLSSSEIIKMFVDFPLITTSSEAEYRKKVDFLTNYCGVLKCDTVKVLKRGPSIVGMSIDKQLKPKVDYLTTSGIAGEDLRNFLIFHTDVIFMKMETLEARLNRAEMLGLTREQYIGLVKQQPSILNCRDQVLVEKISFLRRFCKVPLEELVTNSAYITYSLEKRVKPRLKFVAWLMMNGYMHKLYRVLTILVRTEVFFHEKFVEPFGEEAAAAYAKFLSS